MPLQDHNLPSNPEDLLAVLDDDALSDEEDVIDDNDATNANCVI
jgi:hypothetical protein